MQGLQGGAGHDWSSLTGEITLPPHPSGSFSNIGVITVICKREKEVAYFNRNCRTLLRTAVRNFFFEPVVYLSIFFCEETATSHITGEYDGDGCSLVIFR
jgi:hypothetical protein